MTEQSLLPRITRDISDGLIVLDQHGSIVFSNPSARQLLGSSELDSGSKYASIMMNDSHSSNDEFHQFLLDAVYDKQKTHKGEIFYTRPDGSKRLFQLTSSFLFGDDGEQKDGVVIQFSDITDLSALRIKNNDAARVLFIAVSCLCVWVFLCTIWDQAGRPIPEFFMTKFVELAGIGVFIFLWRSTSITFADMGLRIKGAGRAVLVDSIITAVIVTLMVAAKYIIIRFFPDVYGAGAPLFLWNLVDYSDYIYPLTVVTQEFLTRGVMHESIKRILPGDHDDAVAILISSLFFGCLHIHMGIAYMVGSFLLLSIFGIIYRKQKTIWGLCIPHFFLGEALKFIFGF